MQAIRKEQRNAIGSQTRKKFLLAKYVQRKILPLQKKILFLPLPITPSVMFLLSPAALC